MDIFDSIRFFFNSEMVSKYESIKKKYKKGFIEWCNQKNIVPDSSHDYATVKYITSEEYKIRNLNTQEENREHEANRALKIFEEAPHGFIKLYGEYLEENLYVEEITFPVLNRDSIAKNKSKNFKLPELRHIIKNFDTASSYFIINHVNEIKEQEKIIIKAIEEERITLEFQKNILSNKLREKYYQAYLKTKHGVKYEKRYVISHLEELDKFIQNIIKDSLESLKSKYPLAIQEMETTGRTSNILLELNSSCRSNEKILQKKENEIHEFERLVSLYPDAIRCLTRGREAKFNPAIRLFVLKKSENEIKTLQKKYNQAIIFEQLLNTQNEFLHFCLNLKKYYADFSIATNKLKLNGFQFKNYKIEMTSATYEIAHIYKYGYSNYPDLDYNYFPTAQTNYTNLKYLTDENNNPNRSEKKWTLLNFSKEFGKMKVGTFINSSTGEEFKSCIFIAPNKDMTFVAFSSQIGELTPSEIKARKNRLQVIKNNKSNIYKLCQIDYQWIEQLESIIKYACKIKEKYNETIVYIYDTHKNDIFKQLLEHELDELCIKHYDNILSLCSDQTHYTILVAGFVCDTFSQNDLAQMILSSYPNSNIIYMSLAREYTYSETESIIIQKKKERNREIERFRRISEEEKKKLDYIEMRENEVKQNLEFLSRCVSNLEVIKNSDLRYFAMYNYYPTTCTFEATQEEWNIRYLIWNFKASPTQPIPIERIIDFQLKSIDTLLPLMNSCLKRIFGDMVKLLTLVCIPASSQIITERRYKEFCKKICNETLMTNSFEHIRVVQEGEAKHVGGQKKAIYEVDQKFFEKRFVLMFDDVITTGRSMLVMKKLLEESGAYVVGAFSIGKTCHERIPYNPIEHIEDYI